MLLALVAQLARGPRLLRHACRAEVQRLLTTPVAITQRYVIGH